MYRPRRRTRRSASPNANVPAATFAEYSPRLWPATHAGVMPRDSSSRHAAVLTARIAGCVFSVSISRSSGPLKMMSLSGSPSAASASANVSRQMGCASASALPMPAFCAPCPGKMNAMLTMSIWSLSAGPCPPEARVGDVLLHPLDEPLRREAVRHRDGVAHGLRARSSVADDGHAGDAEQRRAAVLRVVHARAEVPHGPPRQQRADARRDRARQLLFEQRLDDLDESFADLQRHVSREPVADDHVGIAAV